MQNYDLVQYRGVWCLYWREDGQPKRRSLGTADKKEALIAKAEVERIEQQQAASSITIEEIWNRYKLTVDGRPAGTNMGFEARNVLPHFGAILPMHLTDEIVDDYIEKRRADGKSDGTILTDLNRLATALSWAAKKGLIEKAPHVKRPSRPPPRDRHLTRAEAKLLLEAAAPWPHIKTFIILGLTTGARAQAIKDLTWDRVNFERGLVNFHSEAEGRPMKGRVICPMNQTLRAALEAAKGRAVSDHVIEWAGRKVGSVKKGIAAAAKRAGLDDVTPHVFRHTAAVWMAEDDTPMPKIAQFLGHSDSRITEKVYARYSPSHLREAASSLELV